MLGSHSRRFEPLAAKPMHEDRAGRRAILPSARKGRHGGPLATAGLVLGYLFLVAVLTVAPFWQQTVAPQSNAIPMHTDFGGSR